MDLTSSPKPRPLSRYVGDKIRDPYYSNPRPGKPQQPPSPVKRGSRSKTARKALPSTSPSKPYRRPASKPLGYNPFARYRHDEIVDYGVFEPMSDLAARQHPANFSRTWDVGEYTVPRLRNEEEEEEARARELEARNRLKAEERAFNRRLRAFEREEMEKADWKWKGKGREVDRDEDGGEDEGYDVESGLEDVDMLDVV